MMFKHPILIAPIVVIIGLAYFTVFFSPDYYRRFDKPMIIFMVMMYLIAYIIQFILENHLSAEKLVGKDLAFIVIKFLILIFYAAIRQYYIQDIKDKEIFLFHFLIYAVAFMIIDVYINYQIINKKNG